MLGKQVFKNSQKYFSLWDYANIMLPFKHTYHTQKNVLTRLNASVVVFGAVMLL